MYPLVAESVSPPWQPLKPVIAGLLPLGGGVRPALPRSAADRYHLLQEGQTSDLAIRPCARSTCWSKRSLRPLVSPAEDVTSVLVPNVMRGADDFISGAIDALYFALEPTSSKALHEASLDAVIVAAAGELTRVGDADRAVG